jgi:VWFA-related protein
VVRDANGNVPRDLKPQDFILLEEGVEQQIIGIEYLQPASRPAVEKPAPGEAAAPAAPAERGQIVIFVQQTLSSTYGLRASLKALAAQAEMLVRLGDVELVADDPTPHVVLAATGDAARVRAACEDLAARAAGGSQIVRIRSELLLERNAALEAQTQVARMSANKHQISAMAAQMARKRSLGSAQQEAVVLRARQDALLSWMSRYPATEQKRLRSLLLVTDGFDLSLEFYEPLVASDQLSLLRSFSAVPHQQEITRSIAASGWTVISVAPGWMTSAPEFDASSSGRASVGASAFSSTNLNPLNALNELARESGGSVAVDMRRLPADLSAISERVSIAYQARRPRDGKVHRVEIKSRRPGVTVRAQQWVVSGTPEAVDTARATTLAGGAGERGDLPVQCSVRPLKGDESEVEATVSLTPIDALRPSLKSATLRFAIAVTSDDAPPVSIIKRMDNLDLAAQPNWRITFQVRHRPDAKIAVVAGEQASGAWGGAACGTGVAAALPPAPVAAVPPSPPGKFLPLDAALAAAKASGRIILLYLRGSSHNNNARAERWFAGSESHETIKSLYADVVMATAIALTAALPDLAPYRGQRTPQLLVLDPGGALVEDLGFLDYGDFATELAALRRQNAVFARSAAARDAGRIAESLLLRGNALLYAGVREAPGPRNTSRELLTQALQLAQAGHDEVIAQDAQLGLATILSLETRQTEAIGLMEKVAGNPATPELGARAWILIGNLRKARGDNHAAVDAYQNGYRLAPKPSEFATFARRNLESLGSAPESELQSVAGAVRLLYPHRPVLTGTIEVAAVAPPGTARVEFYLDDARVAERTRPPFQAKLNLGGAAKTHGIRAVAFDARDVRLGEDAATINDRVDALAVEIVSPRAAFIESSAVIELQPRLPEGSTLQAIDLYWNEQKLATLTAAPFRYNLTLPSKNAFGYIRAVARDSAGATAEDAMLINSEGGAAEEVRVDAVELYAIVHDRAGRNVEGLTASDFVVKEDGVPVTVEVRNAATDPIAVALALDVSDSMRTSMAMVMEYAAEFLRGSMAPGDRTLVVTFADTPTLQQPLTANLQQVRASILDTQASGGTALWDAIIYSLDQLRGAKEKRALLLFTDGVDNGSRAKPKAALEHAREIGVPVYIVRVYTGASGLGEAVPGLMSMNRPATTAENYLQMIAEQSGGAVFSFPRQKDLPKLFQKVRDDTRGAYTLTFVSRSAKKRTEMRKISVSVARRGVVVRAPSAYYPR